MLTALALPVDGILQSLGATMFSEIATEQLPVRAFYPADLGVQEYTTAYLDSLQSVYIKKVDDLISTLAGIQARSTTSTPPHESNNTAAYSNTENMSPSKRIPTSPKESRALKRSHSRASLSAPNDENRSPHRASETKALKNAKLLKALRDVEKTLGSMEVEEQQRLNEVF